MEATATKATFQKYPAYRDSGVEWLGEIPEHWEIGKLGTLLKPVSLKNRPDLPLLSITREAGVIERNIEDDSENHNFIPDDLSGYKVLNEGQFGMNKMKAWQGSYGIAPMTGIVSPAYYVFDFNSSINPRFFHLAIRSKNYVAFFGQASDGVRVGQWDLSKTRMKEIPFFIPPLPEQTAIAAFLDDKTTKIDRAVAQKEKMIALLKERKQIIIQNAVTKGLDPNVKLKDSGVEWIGEIPEGWEVKRLRNVFRFSKGLTITKENLQEEGIPCVNYGEIHSKYGFEVNPDIHPLKCVSEEYLKDNSNSLIKYGDFIFADTSEDLDGSGNFTYLNFEGTVFAGYHTIIGKPNGSINSRFIAYVLDSLAFRYQVRTRMKGVKVYSITQSILKDLTCWYPQGKEQEKIVAYLDKVSTKIDEVIKLQQHQIAKLKELKSTLIDSAVTGKIMVSEL
jgi:type I restriction enzyme, S subunit